MKKRYLALILLISLGYACKKSTDDRTYTDNSVANNAKLKGTWIAGSSSITYYDATMATALSPSIQKYNYIFDGNSSMTLKGVTANFPDKTSNYTVTSDFNIDYLSYITADTVSQKAVIKTLTATTLSLEETIILSKPLKVASINAVKSVETRNFTKQ